MGDHSEREAMGVQYTYTVILRHEPSGEYTVIVPALPGCLTEGRNLSEAVTMAKDAIECYLGSLLKHDDPIPPDVETVVFDRNDMVDALVIDVTAEVEAGEASYV